MAVTGLESMKGDGMGVFARKNRLQGESTIVAGEAGDATEAQVTNARLHTLALPDNSTRTVTTSQFTVDDSAAVTIASTESNREALVVQNNLPGAICGPFGNDCRIAVAA